VKLRSASISNFLAIGNAAFKLSDQGLILVLGDNQDIDAADSNGAGKSSLFEAICWALYGVTYQGLSHDDVVNNRIGKDTAVTVELEAKGHHLSITRYRKHTTMGNKIKIVVDGKDQTPFNAPDQEKMLVGLLPLSVGAFKHVAYFGQGLGARFSALNDVGRKELLEELLGLEIYAKAHEDAKAKVSGVDRQLATLQGEKSQAEHQITVEEEECKRIEEAEATAKARIVLQQKTLYGARDDVKKKLENAKERLATLEEIHTRAKDNASTQLKHVQGLQQLERDKDRDVSALQGELRRAEKEKKEISSLGTNCITCRQSISVEHVAKLVDAAHQRVHEVMEEIESEEQEAEALARQLTEANQKLATLNHKAHTVGNEVWAAKLDLKQYEAELSQVQEQIRSLLEDSQRSSERIAEQRASVAKANAEIKEIGKKINLADDERNYLAYWEEGFSTRGIRSLILDSVLTYLNGRLAHHATALSDGEISISITPQTKLKSGAIREKMDFKASTCGAGYQAASGGEKRRMDLAVHFALSDLSCLVTGHRLNVLMVDEPGECLDESGIESMLDLLVEKSKEIGSVFLITHNNELKSKIPHVWVVTKKNGVSSVVDQDYTSVSV
jgi:DNA repair exonuclease SbcCD ATPase subunit